MTEASNAKHVRDDVELCDCQQTFKFEVENIYLDQWLHWKNLLSELNKATNNAVTCRGPI